MAAIDFYLSPGSPWTYLAIGRLIQMTRTAGVGINVMPIDTARTMPATGGVPLSERSPERLTYRLQELRRWRDDLGAELNIQPAYHPFDTRPASLAIIAAPAGGVSSIDLAQVVLNGVWRDQRDLADPTVIRELIVTAGGDADAVMAEAAKPETAARYEAFGDLAIAAGVFGVPTFVYRGEILWGQDRLFFLERLLVHSER